MSGIDENMKEERKNGKMRFFVLRKKVIVFVLLSVLLIGASIGGGIGIAAATVETPARRMTIVIDPGHGGIDNGVVGSGGTKEAEFNLTMSKELAKFLTDAGFKVVLTRKDGNGLYKDTDDNFKRADMAARKKIIVDTAPDMVISVHANKFPGDGRRGAQVFFDKMSESGKNLADSIQAGFNLLNNEFVGRSFAALSGDYYMLKCTQKPSVIVECGFLSNTDDEKLLNDASYRQKLAFAIYSGVEGYLNN